MSNDQVVKDLKLSEECKKCDRFNHEQYKCTGRDMCIIPCNWFKEKENDIQTNI